MRYLRVALQWIMENKFKASGMSHVLNFFPLLVLQILTNVGRTLLLVSSYFANQSDFL